MDNRIFILAFVFLVFSIMSSGTVFANGALNVSIGQIATPAYINTNQPTVMLNITLNATQGEVNVSSIWFNLTGNASPRNLSGILIYNDSNINGVVDSSDILVGSNTSINETYTLVNFTTNFTVPQNKQRHFLIVVNITRNATRFNSTGFNITTNTSIIAESTADNITIGIAGFINSTLAQIQDVHANSSVTPNVVDTNVTNQSFVYVVTPTSLDKINGTIINLPVGYSLVRVTTITYDGSNTSSAVSIDGNATGSRQFNISATSSTSQPIIVYFTADTNTSSVNSTAFNSTVSGSNITSTATYNASGFSTNVTTQTIISLLNLRTIKATALANGTDYWEFNFTLNITANVSGIIQFRMNNWTSGSDTINLTNQTTIVPPNTTFYATFRESGNSSNTVNVLNVYYNVTEGLKVTGGPSHQTIYGVMKMVVPSGTPVSDNWWTTYWMLFRSSPR